MAVEGLDALQCCAEGVLEDIFSELGNGKTREDGLAVELVCEPLEEDPSGLSVALTNSGDDVSLVLQGGQIAGVVASQGCLLSSPQDNAGGAPILHKGLVDEAMSMIPE